MNGIAYEKEKIRFMKELIDVFLTRVNLVADWEPRYGYSCTFQDVDEDCLGGYAPSVDLSRAP